MSDSSKTRADTEGASNHQAYYARIFSHEAIKLGAIQEQIAATPHRAGSLIQEWTGVCADTAVTNRPRLLPVVLETFNTSPNRALKTAAAMEVVELAFYFTAATHEETIAGIEGCLCDVNDFANETRNRRLAGLASEKLAELARQVRSLEKP